MPDCLQGASDGAASEEELGNASPVFKFGFGVDDD